MLKDNSKSPSLKNFRIKTGRTIDSGGLRAATGKAKAMPDSRNNSHWDA